jgi:hypothetical protein
MEETRLKRLSVPEAAQWKKNVTKWKFDNDFELQNKKVHHKSTTK